MNLWHIFGDTGEILKFGLLQGKGK